MKYFFRKATWMIPVSAFLVIMSMPTLTRAAGYSISPAVTGFVMMSTTHADLVCRTLLDAIAAQMPFCSLNGSSTPVYSNSGITNLTTSINSSGNLVVSWNSAQPTTTLFRYIGSNSGSSGIVAYENPSQGLTMSHLITIGGLRPAANSMFAVGGMAASGMSSYSTMQGFQLSQ